MRMYYLLLVFLLSGCTILPEVMVDSNTTYDEESSVLLVAVEGKRSINYLQFCHSGLPCMNYRFSAKNNYIFALKMKKGLEKVELNSITYGSSISGYGLYGMPYGFYSVEDMGIDLEESGIYYYIKLNTDDLSVSYEPSKEIIQKAKSRYPQLFNNLKPINF